MRPKASRSTSLASDARREREDSRTEYIGYGELPEESEVAKEVLGKLEKRLTTKPVRRSKVTTSSISHT
jgi:hypothetical protein